MPGALDLERTLSASGFDYMEKLATWAAKTLDPPRTVLCSTATRTRQTLEALQPAWIGADTDIRMEPSIYEATTGRLQSLVEESFRTTDRLMLIGHNPGLEYLSRIVAADVPENQPGRMSPGSLAMIEFPAGWDETEGGYVRHWVGQSQFK